MATYRPPAPGTPWTELVTLRSKDGHTKASLARAAGMSVTYYGQLENGVRRPNPRVIKLLASVLNVPMSMLERRHPEHVNRGDAA